MRDLSDVYDYARRTEQDGSNNDAYEKARAELNDNKRKAALSYQQEVRAQRQSARPKSRRGLIAGIAVAAAAVVILAVVLANQNPSGSQEQNSPGTAASAQGTGEKASATVTTVSAETGLPEDQVDNAAAAPDNEAGAETAEPEQPESAVQSYHGYNIGQIIKYTGTVHYTTSDTDELRGPATAGLAMISAINPNGRHPFHLVHADDTSDVYGWVDEGFLEPV